MLLWYYVTIIPCYYATVLVCYYAMLLCHVTMLCYYHSTSLPSYYLLLSAHPTMLTMELYRNYHHDSYYVTTLLQTLLHLYTPLLFLIFIYELTLFAVTVSG